jgi:hypothetical protein
LTIYLAHRVVEETTLLEQRLACGLFDNLPSSITIALLIWFNANPKDFDEDGTSMSTPSDKISLKILRVQLVRIY